VRILMVTSRFPLPPWRGNQVRAVEWLDALGAHELVVVTPEPEDPTALDELCSKGISVATFPLRIAPRALGLAGATVLGLPFQEGLYRVGVARRVLTRIMREARFDLAIVQMLRCGWAAEVIAAEAPETPLLFDAIDAMGLHFSRSGPSFPVALRPLVRLEAARSKRRERWLVDRARVTTAVSRRDLDALGAPAESSRVVPVAGREVVRGASAALEPTVLLSGNLGYRPTVAAARWFARSVWPRILEHVPDVRWVLAGARPARAIRELARLPGVEVHPNVPDLAPFLAEAAVAVAPMATGSGVPMKVLEAWAAGVPVVAHPWAAQGLVSAPERGVEVASSAEQWVAATARLLTDPPAAEQLARRGRRLWERFYSPERVADAIRDAVGVAG